MNVRPNRSDRRSRCSDRGLADSDARTPRARAALRLSWGSRWADRPRSDSSTRRGAPDPHRPATNSTIASRNAQTSPRSEEHTSELQSLAYLVCRLLLEKKKQYAELIFLYHHT